MVTLTLCLLLWTGCAGQKAVYLQGDSRAYPVTAGAPCPIDGWVVSNAALADLIACCQEKKDGADQ